MCPSSTAAQLAEPNTPREVPDCVPPDPLSQAAYEIVSKHLSPAILNHSLRVWIYADKLSRSPSERFDPQRLPLLFTACIMHDLGTAPAFAHNESPDEIQRFEIEGADAAVALLYQNVPETDIQEVWRAIALHTTPQIAERQGGMIRLLRIAVLADFGGGAIEEDVKRETEEKFPRLEIEKVLTDAVVQQALDSPIPDRKAPPHSWPGDLLREHRKDPNWKEVNKGF